jgi:AcrR family transcriptional regulator
MTADDRRAAILDATVPLLRERGTNVTTREIAAAACVAEGTLFRVFPDKEALVRAAVVHALDPAPLLAELRAIDTDVDLRSAVTTAVELMIRRSREVVALLSASYEATGRMHHPHGPHHGAGHPAAPQAVPEGGPAPADEKPDAQRGPGMFGAHHPLARIAEGLAELLMRHGAQDELRLPPEVCARMLVTVVLAGTRPTSHDGDVPLTAQDIVTLFLDGALLPATPPVPAGRPVPATPPRATGSPPGLEPPPEHDPEPWDAGASAVLVPTRRSSVPEEPC